MKAIVFHSLAHASAALAASGDAQCPITLVTPPQGARYAGPLFYWEVLIQAERATGTNVAAKLIDCGAYGGVAMAALRCGWRTLVFSGPTAVFEKLRSMAGALGGNVVNKSPDALDLLDERDPAAACRRYLDG